MLKLMQTKYDSLLETFKDECFSIIGRCCGDKNVLWFGSNGLTMDYNSEGKLVPYIVGKRYDDSKYMYKIELFSDEGYVTYEDLAHWADVAMDAANCYESGNSKYSVNWNVK